MKRVKTESRQPRRSTACLALREGGYPLHALGSFDGPQDGLLQDAGSPRADHIVCTGSIALANPSWAIWATLFTCGLVRRALVATTP